MDLYAENILDHYKNPRHKGLLKNPSIIHREENTSCGDDITISILIQDRVIKEIKWQGQGCAISQASMSLLSDELEGKTIDEAWNTSKDVVENILGVPIGVSRKKCAFLSLLTIKNALLMSEKKPGINWSDLLQ